MVDRRRKIVSSVDCFDIIIENEIIPVDSIERKESWMSFMGFSDTITEDMALLRSHCAKRSTKEFCPYYVHTMTNSIRKYGIKTISGRKKSQISVNSLDTLLGIKYIVRSGMEMDTKNRSALQNYFIKIYDVFEVAWQNNFKTYLIMEHMTGDGDNFRQLYQENPDYQKDLYQMSTSLLTGLHDGLFRKDLYFSDVKPSNMSFSKTEQEFLFKWIDVECISDRSHGSCSTLDYLDPYNEDVDTEDDVKGKKLFYSDLFKFGLSMYLMVTGSHPLMGMSMFLNASKRQKVIEAHRKVFVCTFPDVLPSLQHLIVSLLHPVGEHRLAFCKSFVDNTVLLSSSPIDESTQEDRTFMDTWAEDGKSMFDDPPLASDSEDNEGDNTGSEDDYD